MFGIDRRRLAGLLVSLGLVAGAPAAWAQDDDLPGRVGRLAEVQGRVWLYDQEQGQWVEAMRNRTLTSGDRLSTERGSRADVRIGSTELRLDGDTELDLDRIDDDRIVLQLVNGSVAVRVRSREIARELELRSANLRVVPERTGHYRIDREDDTTWVAAWRGSVTVDTRDQQVQISAGRRAEFYRDSRDGATAVSWSGPVNDAFSDWVARDEQRDDRAAQPRYVSPEMTGAEDLDRYGRWDRHPEYGMVWFPLQVGADWAPYRHGRWTWSVRWGWTWVDDAPWGFAPFHYGRWVHWGGRWVWSPGAYVARPVYAPALVAWVGGSNVSFSVSIGGYSGPAVGWVPLAPRDYYVPPYRYHPRYVERVNQPHRDYQPRQVPTGPIMYGNRGVPNAVTVVPADVLTRREAVAPAIVRDNQVRRVIEQERFRSDTPTPDRQPRSPRVIAAPGGGEPVRLPPPPGRELRPAPGGGQVIDLRRERPAPAAVPRVEVPAQPQAPARPERMDRIERPERVDRPERMDRIDRPERVERPERIERPERVDRPQAPVREERQDRQQDRRERQAPFEAPSRPVEVRPPVQAVPMPSPQPRVVPSAPTPSPAVAPPRAEPRNDRRERDDRPGREPESRQNQRDRQNQQ
jgi:hypothetical protein